MQRGTGTVQRQQQTTSALAQEQARRERADDSLEAARAQVQSLEAQRRTAEAQIAQAGARLARREQFHINRLSEHAIPSHVQYQEALRRVTEHFLSLGGTASEARRQAFAWIGRQVQTQASHLAYIDVFYALTLVPAMIIPSALLLRRVRLEAPSPTPAH